MNDLLENRATTSFGLSIGTGLALETLFNPTEARIDDDRKIVNVSPTKHKNHVYNIYTLIRNLLASVADANKVNIINSKMFIDTIHEEIAIIHNMYTDISTTPHIYAPDYTAINRKYNKNKKINTKKSWVEYCLVKNTIANTLKSTQLWKPNKTSGKVLLLTNMVPDLVTLKSNDVELLESHTGVVKPSTMWGTKYHPVGKRDLSHLPMLDILLYIFGDKTVVLPETIGVRKEVYDISIEKKWTPRTTHMKIVSDLKNNLKLSSVLSHFKS